MTQENFEEEDPSTLIDFLHAVTNTIADSANELSRIEEHFEQVLLDDKQWRMLAKNVETLNSIDTDSLSKSSREAVQLIPKIYALAEAASEVQKQSVMWQTKELFTHAAIGVLVLSIAFLAGSYLDPLDFNKPPSFRHWTCEDHGGEIVTATDGKKFCAFLVG